MVDQLSTGLFTPTAAAESGPPEGLSLLPPRTANREAIGSAFGPQSGICNDLVLASPKVKVELGVRPSLSDRSGRGSRRWNPKRCSCQCRKT